MGSFKWNYTREDSAAQKSKVEASGTFSVTVDLSTDEGTGKGQGNVQAATSGFCTGKDSVDYTFTLMARLDPVSNNLTLIFYGPNPADSDIIYSYHLSCNDNNNYDTTFDMYSVVPIMITLPAVAGTTVEGNPPQYPEFS